MNSRDKSTMQIIHDLNMKGKPSIQIVYSRIELGDFFENNKKCKVSKMVDIVFHRSRVRITIESTSHEIVETKRDALDKAIMFLNNLSKLAQDVKSREHLHNELFVVILIHIYSRIWPKEMSSEIYIRAYNWS